VRVVGLDEAVGGFLRVSEGPAAELDGEPVRSGPVAKQDPKPVIVRDGHCRDGFIEVVTIPFAHLVTLDRIFFNSIARD
jgi:hypothetical protein